MSTPFNNSMATTVLSIVISLESAVRLWISIQDGPDGYDSDFLHKITTISCCILMNLVVLVFSIMNKETIVVVAQCFASILTQEVQRSEVESIWRKLWLHDKLFNGCVPRRLAHVLQILLPAISWLFQVLGALIQLTGKASLGLILSNIGAGIGWGWLAYESYNLRAHVLQFYTEIRVKLGAHIMAFSLAALCGMSGCAIGILLLSLKENDFISTTFNGLQLCAFSTVVLVSYVPAVICFGRSWIDSRLKWHEVI